MSFLYPFLDVLSANIKVSVNGDSFSPQRASYYARSRTAQVQQSQVLQGLIERGCGGMIYSRRREDLWQRARGGGMKRKGQADRVDEGRRECGGLHGGLEAWKGD